MNPPDPDKELLSHIIDVLASIAPEARDPPLDPELPLREQLELDSMDHLHFTIALHERFGVDIPESDYASMRRLAELARYIAERLPT